MDADRTRNVLDGLLAHVLEAEAQLVAHLIVHDARNHDPAGIGERFQPRRHIDAVAKNIVAVDYDVADIDAMRFDRSGQHRVSNGRSNTWKRKRTCAVQLGMSALCQ